MNQPLLSGIPPSPKTLYATPRNFVNQARKTLYITSHRNPVLPLKTLHKREYPLQSTLALIHQHESSQFKADCQRLHSKAKRKEKKKKKREGDNGQRMRNLVGLRQDASITIQILDCRWERKPCLP